MKENYNELKSLFDTVLKADIADNDNENRNFMEMGGDSIKAMHLVAEAQKMGYDISMEDVMSTDSVEELFEKGKRNQQELWKKYTEGCQELTELGSDDKNRITFSIKNFSCDLFEKAVNMMKKKHDLLRAVRENQTVTILSEASDSFFNSCFTVQHQSEDDDTEIITFLMDAAVSDHMSMQILYNDFSLYYASLQNQEPIKEDEKTAPYFYWQTLKERYRQNYQYFHQLPVRKNFSSNYQFSFNQEYKTTVDRSTSLEQIFAGYQRWIVKEYAGLKKWKLNFYNNNRLDQVEMQNFSNTIGNFEIPSQYDFQFNALLDYKDLTIQNHYYTEEGSENSSFGFVFYPEISQENADCKIQDFYCLRKPLEKVFLEVQELEDSYRLRLYGEVCDEGLERLLAEIQTLTEKGFTETQVGNAGGNAIDKATIFDRYGKDNVQRIYRLLDIQKGMLFHCLENKNNDEYKMQYHVHINLYMDEELVKEAICILADKYPALRTQIVYHDLQEPMQVVLKKWEPQVEIIEVDDIITEEIVSKYVKRDLERKRDFECDSLFSVTILNNYQQLEMIWNFHHILADGWSMPVIFGDFQKYYEMLLYGEDINYRVSNSYERYVNRIYSRDILKGIGFWKKYLENYEEETDIIPLKAGTSEFKGKSNYIQIFSKETKQKILELTKKQSVTFSNVLELAMGIVLQKYNDSKDIVFGRVVSGRDLSIEGTIKEVGLFVNTLPVRITDQDNTVEQMLEKVKKNDLKIGQYEYCSLAQIIRETGKNPVKILYAYENFLDAEVLLNKSDEINAENLRDETNYDLTVIVNNFEQLEWKVVYETSKYSESEIIRFTKCVEKVLTNLPDHLETKISDMEIVSEEEKEIILKKFNSTEVDLPKERSVSDLFEEIAEKYPDKCAIRYYDTQISYKELNELADQYVHEMKELNVHQGSHVCIMAHKKPETIASIIAVLKTGAIYIPVDPENPAERVEYILHNADAMLLLDCGKMQCLFEKTDMEDSQIDVESHVAYMMYTSGTSGKPKAVMVTHQGIIRLVRNTNYIQLDKSTCMLQGSSLAFDASTLEIWGTLLNGGTLCMADTQDVMDVVRLDQMVTEWGVNTLWLTAALFNQFMDEKPAAFQTLRVLATGGERLSEKHADLFLKNHKDTILLNGYGPTENTTFTTVGKVEIGRQSTIGKPISNTTVYIMNQGQLCPIGVCGELCTGGLGVATGYYKEKELTDKVFEKNPFGEGKIYRTKDKARWLENGEIEFWGRLDQQVKIRGFRIEPDEISKTVEQISGIHQCVTTIDSNKKISTYYVSSQDMQASQIFQILKEKLPDYMIPRYYLRLNEIPVTINGKVDYKKLPQIQEPVRHAFVQPENEEEREMVRIFERTLNLKQVGMQDDFIELGGNSLLAVKLANEIEKKFGIRIDLRDIMKERTPAKIVCFVSQHKNCGENKILRAEEKEAYEMSSVQKRMFMLQKMNPESMGYNIPMILKFREKIQIPQLIQAIKELVIRHEALRTYFVIENQKFIQKISDETIQISLYEGVSLEEAEAIFMRPFNLEKELPFRAGICTGTENCLLLDVHHIVADGISTTVMMREILTLYNGGTLKPVTCQYKDYSEWQIKHHFDKEQQYWTKQFEDAPVPLDFPCDNERKSNRNYEGNTIEERIDTEDIRWIAEKFGVTEYAVFLSAWFILLNRYSRQEDITLGTPVAGRMHAELEQTIGMFVNTLPVRMREISGQTLGEFICKLSEITYDVFENQEYPLYEILENLNLPRDITKQPLFDIIFALRDQREQKFLEELGVEPISLRNHTAKFDLSLEVGILKDSSYTINLEYSTELFKEDTAQRILQHYVHLLKIMREHIVVNVENIEMLTLEEKEQILYQFNNTKTSYEDHTGIIEVFQKNANERPEAFAICDEHRKITYKDADEMSEKIAAMLKEQGIVPGDVVAIETVKSVDIILVILGILKTGAIYVPVEPMMPLEKKEFIIKDSCVKVYLGQSGKKEEIERVVSFKSIDEVISEGNMLENVRDCTRNSKWDECVYYMYTSGTTGQPKAVMVTNRNILRLVRNTNYVPLNCKTKMILGGSLAFDASTFEIWGALLNGGTVFIPSTDTFVNKTKLKLFIHNNGINTMWLTSSLFNQMIEADHKLFCELDYLLVGGEKLSKQHVEIFMENNSNTILINGYGPTENTTFTTTYQIPRDFQTIYIGKPIANTQVYIMQNNTLCGIGVWGELCTSGDGVAKGYLNNLELTQDKFVSNPFGEGKMYRTGDIARFLSDGNIEYGGRVDSQVKIRGFRVELSGIQQIMETYPGITRAVVIASAEKELKAYYVADEKINSEQLYRWLKTKLPVYMVPSCYMQIEQMPLTSNGKMDYKKLPENREVIHTDYVAPITENEKIIAELFEQLLSVDMVGIDDHFFEMGGHSLKATLLCNQLETIFGVSINVSDIFANPTVRQLAECIAQTDNQVQILPKAQEQELYEASSAQKRIYFACQMNRNALLYNMPMFFECEDNMEEKRVETAFQTLLERHESLRTVFFKKDGKIYQKVIPTDQICFSVQQVKREQFVHPFNLEKAPLIHVGIAEEDEKQYLCIDVHHIASDGYGMNILIREFLQIYQGETLLPECIQYKDYSEWMRTRDISSQQNFWMKQYEEDVPVLNLFTDYKREPEKLGHGKSCQVMVRDTLSDKMKEFANRHGMTEYMIYLSVVSVLLGKYSRSSKFTLGTVMANRTVHALEGIVGMFANTIAMPISWEPSDTVEDFLRKMYSICTEAVRNQEYPYDQLVDDLKLKRDRTHNPMFDVMFVYQVGLIQKENQKLKYVDMESPVAKFDLTVNINRTDHLYIKMEYDSSLYKESTIMRMLNSCLLLMEVMCVSEKKKLSELSFLTDAEKELVLYGFNPKITKIKSRPCIHQMFEEQVTLCPEKIAVKYYEQELTYNELNTLANQVAVGLIKQGIRKGDFVCVMAHRTPETIVALLGIMKAGAVYVPVDPVWPHERKKYVSEDCCARFCLGSESDQRNTAGLINNISAFFKDETSEVPNVKLHTNDPAYCIYTSGTSGKPKGVLVSHEGVWSLRKYFLTSQEIKKRPISLQFASFAFDASISELCMGILSGNTMVMVPDEIKYDARKLEQFLNDQKVDIGIIPPQYLDLMKQTGLKTVISAGSETNPEIVKQHSQNAVYSNDYGPTEATVCATYWKYDGKGKIPYRIPIGKPIYNKKIYIMENNTLCGIQIPGEICIAGDGIALGYLNRPKLTDERFVQNPFGEGKMYRSGDLGRWTEDGNVEYLGRLDSQIKIRGFRVELAEVENALLQIEGVNTATVIAYEKENRNLILLAFYTGEQRNEADIKVMLAQSLPNYMIPSKCLWMNVIPMNTSGKINRQKLIEFYKQHLVYTSKNKDYSGWTNAQKLVKAIWEEVLEEEVTELTQDFFDMGGNSLNLFSVADKMEKQGVIVSVSELYQYPTLELLASEIVEEQLSGGEIIELKPLVNEVVFVDGLHENQDTFSWSDVNCYYKPRAICHGKYKKDFYNEYLMMLSFCAIYQVENLFGSFDEKERQEELEQFGKQITDPIMNLHTENYVFDSLPEKDEFQEMLMNEVRQNHPVIVAGDSAELYYSEDYKKMPHAHYFILKGFNERKGLWHILDTLQYNFGAEPVYREFVMPFDLLYSCVLSYGDKLAVSGKEAWASVIYQDQVSDIPNDMFLTFFRDFLKKIDQKEIPHSYIDIAFLKYMEANQDKLQTLDEEERIEKLSYVSSLFNMRPVYFILLEEMLKTYLKDEEILSILAEKKTNIIETWRATKIIIWDILNGKMVNMELLQQMLEQGIGQEEEFRKIVLSILDRIVGKTEKKEQQLSDNEVYIENPLGAEVTMQENGFEVKLSGDYRYDMWNGEVNAVRVGKKYEEEHFFIETTIEISFNGNEIYQDGIAIHFEDRTSILFGPVITDKKSINIFYPWGEKYNLYEEGWDGESVRLRVEGTGDTLIFKIWKEGMFKTIKRMKATGKVMKAELFTRTWERYNHTAKFENIQMA